MAHGIFITSCQIVSESGLSSCAHRPGCPVACRIFITQPGFEPCIARQIPNHWTTREVPDREFKQILICRVTTWIFPMLNILEVCCQTITSVKHRVSCKQRCLNIPRITSPTLHYKLIQSCFLSVCKEKKKPKRFYQWIPVSKLLVKDSQSVPAAW